MKKSYVTPQMVCIVLSAPMLLAGSPVETHNEVSTSDALSRGGCWADDEEKRHLQGEGTSFGSFQYDIWE